MQNDYRLLLSKLMNSWLRGVGLTQARLLSRLHGRNYPYTNKEVEDFFLGNSEPPGLFFAHLILCIHVDPDVIKDWRNNQVTIWSQLSGKAYMHDITPLVSIDGEIGEGWEQVRQMHIDHIVSEYDREIRWGGF